MFEIHTPVYIMIYIYICVFDLNIYIYRHTLLHYITQKSAFLARSKNQILPPPMIFLLFAILKKAHTKKKFNFLGLSSRAL